jgi:hypothetical protein
MSKEKFIDQIEEALEARELPYTEISISYYDSDNFGNSEVVVTCSIGVLKITRDRGQTFIDILDSKNTFIPIEKVYPKVEILQKSGSWSLLDQLMAIS